MLDVGTKVFIKPLFKNGRPEPTGKEYNMQKCNAVIKGIIGNGYYMVAHHTTSGVIHEDELVNMETYEPRYKPGDKVRICRVTHSQEQLYIPCWVDDMSGYIGRVVTIERQLTYPHCYKVKENSFSWEDISFEPICTFIGY